jgi:peptidoglycan/xylan/chitin deacetylase (PgdA/CDA1 family)
LAALLAVLVVALVVVVAETGGAKRHRTSANPLIDLGPAAPRHRESALEARGNATIRRLAKLALPVYCGADRGRKLALTFDDGPGVYTHYAVRKLAQAHERATFFVVGKSIEAWPDWPRRELRVGTLADHTFMHADLARLAPAQVRSELKSDTRLIEHRSGQSVDLFRPPYGAQDATVNQIARHLGLLDIMWSMDSRDSLGANWAGIIKNVKSDLRPGAIILMHENRGQTIRALTTLLPLLHRRHLQSVSLPELFADDPPTVAQLRKGLAACHVHAASPASLAGAA